VSFANYPEKYLLFNAQMSKNLVIVMQIEGIDDLFGISDTYTQVRYGDAGLTYGLPGLVYGGLRRIGSAQGEGGLKPYIVLDAGLTISQRIEPEQGKGNVGMITITLIDKNGEVSRIIAPGITIDEIMLKKEVKIWLGFKQTSFPEDYLLIYRGYITSLSCPPSLVKLQISDSTTKKRQGIFLARSTILADNIDDSETTIPVGTTAGMFEHILGPDGTYDPIVRTYIKIDDEWMEYDETGIISADEIEVVRGGSSSLGTTPEEHEAGAQVTNGVQLGGNVGGVNFITLALKILLSGWNGPCETGVAVLSFVYTYDIDVSGPFVDNAFVLTSADAKKDLGLTVGDYFEISDATNPANNTSGVITEIREILGGRNRLILTDQTFTLENPSTATVSFRSKYDTLPTLCGAKCRMRDVDVETLELIRSKYFAVASSSNGRFFYDAPRAAKDVVDTDIFLPIGCYGVSRYGRISMSITKPPLPGVGKMVELNWTNILDPEKIVVNRSTNSRGFFNLIKFEYNKLPASGDYTRLDQFLDTDSLDRFDQVSVLSIQAPGLQADLGGATIARSRGKALLNRYKSCVLIIELTVNWSVGSLIEVSDIILLRDEGRLKIMNFETGERNLGVQLFEVVDRSYSPVQGTVSLKLMGGLGFNVDSRFALYSPSSQIGAGASTTEIPLKPSYGQTTITAELAKWTPYIGQPVQVHSFDWVNVSQSVITGYGAAPGSLTLDPPLSFTPSEDDILDIAPYPTSTDKNEQSTYKLLFAHFTPTIAVTSGVSGTEFNVSLGDAANLTVGNFVILRNSAFTVISEEIKIASIVGTLVTLEEGLGFTPTGDYFVEGIGYKDGLSFYRFG